MAGCSWFADWLSAQRRHDDLRRFKIKVKIGRDGTEHMYNYKIPVIQQQSWKLSGRRDGSVEVSGVVVWSEIDID